MCCALIVGKLKVISKETSLKLVVGLGNPGAQYERSRHNVGFWLIHKLAEQHNKTLRLETKFKGLIANLHQLLDIVLLCPVTFMNNSGEAVLALANFYRISSNEILVVHDDLDLLPGAVRLKFGGGHGGHNGLRSIITHLNTNEFYRLRIGIGHPGDKSVVSDYVLSKPTAADTDKIFDAIDRSIAVLPDVFCGNINRSMQILHT